MMFLYNFWKFKTNIFQILYFLLTFIITFIIITSRNNLNRINVFFRKGGLYEIYFL